ncbi:MAG: hypothetical protein LBB11_01085 [Puniceicoccales bacterium]|jgi:hypothetical protein|nr:hypothetical protein [Puniceicoccales bacterium]
MDIFEFSLYIPKAFFYIEKDERENFHKEMIQDTSQPKVRNVSGNPLTDLSLEMAKDGLGLCSHISSDALAYILITHHVPQIAQSVQFPIDLALAILPRPDLETISRERAMPDNIRCYLSVYDYGFEAIREKIMEGIRTLSKEKIFLVDKAFIGLCNHYLDVYHFLVNTFRFVHLIDFNPKVERFSFELEIKDDGFSKKTMYEDEAMEETFPKLMFKKYKMNFFGDI